MRTQFFESEMSVCEALRHSAERDVIAQSQSDLSVVLANKVSDVLTRATRNPLLEQN